MPGDSNIRQIGLLSLYGLSFAWSPMFGTSEALVFPSLVAFPDTLLLSRVCNLAAFGFVMGALAIAGERIRSTKPTFPAMAAIAAIGCAGMLVGALVGMGVLPLLALAVGAVARGLFHGALTVFWIDVLIHASDKLIGAGVSAALALYAVIGLLVHLAGSTSAALACILLVACPALSCLGCARAARTLGLDEPVDQERTKAPLRTRCQLYAANFCYGVIFGTLLYYFARYDDLPSIAMFLLMSAALFAVFMTGPGERSANLVYRGFMMCFAIAAALILLCGWMSHPVATLAASAALAFLILYTVLIFVDTQARMRNPFWKVPGTCQVCASVGMIAAAVLFQAVFPDGDLGDAQLVLLAAVCIIFVASIFSPSERTRLRPWGFSSLIPAESPEARTLRRCGELAEECGLTSRELEILQQLAAGMTKDQIAEALVISPSTAKTHIRNIYAKMGVHSQRELSSMIDS